MMASWWRGGGGFLLASLPPPCRLAPASEYHGTIQPVPRELIGCRVAAKKRAAGRIPSVVVASGGAGAVASNRQLLTTDANQIRELLKQSPFSPPLPSGSRSAPGPAHRSSSSPARFSPPRHGSRYGFFFLLKVLRSYFLDFIALV